MSWLVEKLDFPFSAFVPREVDIEGEEAAGCTIADDDVSVEVGE